MATTIDTVVDSKLGRSKRVGSAEASLRDVPILEGGLPVVGFGLEFKRNPVEVLSYGNRELGSIFGFRLAGQDVVALIGAEAQTAFFDADASILSAREVYQFTVPMFGKGIAYDLPRPQMEHQLGILAPALHRGVAGRFPKVIEQEVSRFLARLPDIGDIDVAEMMDELTMRTTMACLLGPAARDLFADRTDEGLVSLYRDLQGGLNALGFFMPHLPTSAHRRRDRARRALTRMLRIVVADRRRERREADEPEHLLDALLSATRTDGTKLDHDEIVGVLLATLFVGQRPSAALGTWFGLEMLAAPELATILRGDSAAEQAAAVDVEHLQASEVWERAFLETERLHPPLVVLARKVLRSFEVQGYRLQPGTIAMVSPAVAHRLESEFTRSDRFDPDRFQNVDVTALRKRHALIGFGGGHQRCMGRPLASLQLKLIWAHWLQQFELGLESRIPSSDYESWVVGPASRARMTYRRRG